MSVTESHSCANGNRPIEEAMRDVDQVVPLAHQAGVEVEGGLACIFGSRPWQLPWRRACRAKNSLHGRRSSMFCP